MTRLLLHPWLTVRAAFALGLVFILAAWPKIVDPPGFAKAIWLYQLAPAWSIHLVALILPWFELLCGVALCLGLWLRASASACAAMLLAFIAALSINLARHHPVDCGCFSTSAPVRSDAERLQDMKMQILRDLGLLLLAAQVIAASSRQESGFGKARRLR